MAATLIVIPSYLLWHLWRVLQGSSKSWGIETGALLGLIAAGAFITWFLYLFTGFVNEQKLSQLVLLCYLFCFSALASPLLSLVVFFVPEAYMIKSPIGIIHGCSEPPGPNTGLPPNANQATAGPKKWLADEIDCDKGSNQWVINVGGVITSWPGAPGILVKDFQTHDGLLRDVQFQKVDNEGNSGDKPQAQNGLRKRGEPPAFPLRIQGGLVVPLYVVVLSLMGGAVSMTRRVPEYQRRTLDIEDRDMTPDKARENLVFQIMQVFSAPLVAVTAYYLFEPDSGAKSVLLGFVSGFASEPILLAIRALVEKLTPAASLSTDSLGKLVGDFKTRSPEEKKILEAALKTNEQGAAKPPLAPGAAK